jgi:hypothetical protein
MESPARKGQPEFDRQREDVLSRPIEDRVRKVAEAIYAHMEESLGKVPNVDEARDDFIARIVEDAARVAESHVDIAVTRNGGISAAGLSPADLENQAVTTARMVREAFFEKFSKDAVNVPPAQIKEPWPQLERRLCDALGKYVFPGVSTERMLAEPLRLDKRS